MNNYYTYCYYDDKGVPYYIGQGKGSRIDNPTGHILPPPERRLKLKENLTQEESLKHERYMIYVLGRRDLGTGCLLNRSGGVGGNDPSDERREQLKQSMIGNQIGSREGWDKQSKNKSSWYVFTSPEGEEHKEFTSLRKFSEEHDMNYGHLKNVCRGVRKHHKGWTVRKVSTPH